MRFGPCRRAFVVVLIAIVAFMLLIAVCTFVPCRRYVRQMDANSGCTRVRRQIAGVTIHAEVVETPFALLAKKYSLNRAPANWRTTAENASPLIGDSKEYICHYFGDVEAECSQLAKALETAECDDAKQKEMVAKFLDLMRSNKSSRDVAHQMRFEVEKIMLSLVSEDESLSH